MNNRKIIELFNTHVDYKFLFRWLKEKGILKTFLRRFRRQVAVGNIRFPNNDYLFFLRNLAYAYKYPSRTLFSRLTNERTWSSVDSDTDIWQRYFTEYKDFHDKHYFDFAILGERLTVFNKKSC